MGDPLDGGSNERKRKKLCPPSVGVYVPPVVESATMYKCGQVQNAEEYICRCILLPYSDS